MHNGEVRFTKFDDAAGQSWRAEEWFTNASIIVACGNVIRNTMKASFLRSDEGKLYLKVERVDPSAEVAALESGVFMQAGDRASLKGLSESNIRPGLHEIHNIIRLCRAKNLQDDSQKIWKERKMFLRGIADMYKDLDEGLFEASLQSFSGDADKATNTESRLPSFQINEPKFQQFLNDWTQRARRTRPIDRTKLEMAIDKLYRLIGLPTPKIAYASNPLIMVMSAAFATSLAHRRHDPNTFSISQQAGRRLILGAELYEMTVSKAFTLRDTFIDEKILKAFDERMNDPQLRHFRAYSSDIAGDAFHCAITDAHDAIRSETGSLLKEPDFALETKLAREIFKCTATAVELSHENGREDIATGAGDTSVVDQLTQTLSHGSALTMKALTDAVLDCRSALTHCNTQEYDEFQIIALSRICDATLPDQNLYDALQNVWNECGLIFMHKDFCIVSEYPTQFNVDENGDLHGEGGPSLAWKDGWKLYHWQGIRIGKRLAEAPDSITTDDIEAERNLEVRRLMLDRYGITRFLVDVGAKEIQRDECGILYRHVIDPAFETIVMVEVTNSTPEADGTFKKYFLRVPPNITTARAAVAWTFNLTSNEYQPQVQT